MNLPLCAQDYIINSYSCNQKSLRRFFFNLKGILITLYQYILLNMQTRLQSDQLTGRLSLVLQEMEDYSHGLQTEEEGLETVPDQPDDVYMATSLIATPNCTLADVGFEEIPCRTLREVVQERITRLTQPQSHQRVFDPRKELRLNPQLRRKGSMLIEAKVKELAQKARDLLLGTLGPTSISPALRLSPASGVAGPHQLELLSYQSQDPLTEEAKWIRDRGARPGRRFYLRQKKAESAKLKSKQQEAVIKALREKGGLSISQIAKRCSVTKYRVYKVLSPFAKTKGQKHRIKHAAGPRCKLHNRAKQLIRDYITHSKSLIQSGDIRRHLRTEHGCNISRYLIIKYMRRELGLAYKRLSLVNPQQNTPDCLLQRQFASQLYISMLDQGVNIINIDESILRSTDSRRRGWTDSSRNTQPAYFQRLTQTTIIAGISSAGELYYTINKGATNGQTFLLYLCKLVAMLDSRPGNWRSNTLFMVDNASYHRSQLVSQCIAQLGLDVMFLGPYQYKMAPIEKLFSIIKNRDLNQLRTRIHSRASYCQYLRELGVTISKLERQWIRPAFISHLTGALQALSLQEN